MSADLAEAKREAERARARLAATLAELQARLKPATLASNAWEGVKDKSGELADDAVQAVKGRPVAVSAALAAFTLFLARAPIKSAIADFFSDEDEAEPSAPAPPAQTKAKPAARRRQKKSEGVSA
jgi:hypothetical protein